MERIKMLHKEKQAAVEMEEATEKGMDYSHETIPTKLYIQK